MSVQSWLREAVDVMRVSRSKNPTVSVVKMCGTLGSTVAETAGSIGMTVAALTAGIEGRQPMHTDYIDLLVSYWGVLWWHHCYRLNRVEAYDQNCIAEVFRGFFASARFQDLPERIRVDWQEAQKAIKGKAISENERKLSEARKNRLKTIT